MLSSEQLQALQRSSERSLHGAAPGERAAVGCAGRSAGAAAPVLWEERLCAELLQVQHSQDLCLERHQNSSVIQGVGDTIWI